MDGVYCTHGIWDSVYSPSALLCLVHLVVNINSKFILFMLNYGAVVNPVLLLLPPPFWQPMGSSFIYNIFNLSKWFDWHITKTKKRKEEKTVLQRIIELITCYQYFLTCIIFNIINGVLMYKSNFSFSVVFLTT